jgi:predicted RNase H-like HicB family nuclease
MMEFAVLYEEGPTSWGASVPDLPRCFAVGSTYEERERLIREAIEIYIEELEASGEQIPTPAYRTGQVVVAA